MTRKNKIEVFEHETLRFSIEGKFNKKHFDALMKLNELNDNKYFTGTYNGIKFKHFVGVIQTLDLTIEILPKIDKTKGGHWKEVLLEMLETCNKLKARTHGEANVKKSNLNLLDIYYNLFLSEIEYLQKRGLIKQYRRETKNLKVLKGKLEISGNITKNIIHKERFYTTHETYDLDHTLHKIIAEALLVVEQFTKGTQLFDKCKRVQFSFPEQKRLKVNSLTFENISYNRKNEPYRKVVNYAKLILLNLAPNITAGNENMLALLFDMNKLWEEYIYISLKKASLQDSRITIKAQENKAFWRNRRIKPDIVVRKGNQTIIIDTKWKRTSKEKASIEDLRQMYAYNNYWKADQSILLYPSKNDSIEFYTGNYYLNNGEGEDVNSSCKIEYLNIIGPNGLKQNWADTYLKSLQFGIGE